MTELWATVLGAASAFVLLANAAEKFVKVFKAAKAPEQKQDNEIEELKTRLTKVEEWMKTEEKQVKYIREGNHVLTKGMLALLEHGINGNNIDQMRDAKNGVEAYLINH